MQVYVFTHPDSQIVTLQGPDAADFLNRLSSQNFKNFDDGEVRFGAFLNGKALLIALFTVWKTEGIYNLFFEKESFEAAYSYLNQMHFSENLKIEKITKAIYEVRGTLVPGAIQAFPWGIAGGYVFSEKIVPENAKPLSQGEFDSLRASYGFPKFQQDITSENILIEGPFESLVDRNKGCYPGQEVIEKIYTYGRLPKKVFKVLTENKISLVLPQEIIFEGQNVGSLTGFYSWQSQSFGLATLKKHFTDKQDAFELQGHKFKIDKR